MIKTKGEDYKKNCKNILSSNTKSKKGSNNTGQMSSLKKKRDRSKSDLLDSKESIIKPQYLSKQSGSKKENIGASDTTSSKTNEMNFIEHFEFDENPDCDSNYLLELEDKKQKNFVDLNYFQTKQCYLNSDMRSILCDWMMLLSSQLNFKRETFHLAVMLLDISLSKLNPIMSSNLQLVGVCCLIIAAKFEEIVCPNMQIYAYTTGGAYTTEVIVQFEQTLLKVLGWSLKYPTMSLWANMISFRWDSWVNLNRAISISPQLFSKLPIFRIGSLESFSFNRFFRCADLVVLDFEYVNYDPCKFLCAVLYLLVGRFINSFSEEFIMHQLSRSENLAELDNLHDLNSLMDAFYGDYIGLGLHEIAEYIVLAAPYFSLNRRNQDKLHNSEKITFVSNSNIIYLDKL